MGRSRGEREKSNRYNEANDTKMQKEFNTMMLATPEDIGKNNPFNILICFKYHG
jgi:hypothetical protein